MLKRTFLVLLVAGSFLSCSKPRLDSTSDETLKASTARVRDSLPEGRRAQFDDAIMAVAANELDFGKLMAGSAGVGSMEASVKQALNGKTGEEVIAHAEKLRKDREEKERTQALAEIKELEGKQAKAAQAREKLVAFEIVRSRFYKTSSGFLGDQPVVELTVKNGTATAVSRAHFRGTLSSPGRSVPWLRDDFNYEISGGLEPGETATWRLSPNMFSAWGKVEAPKDAVLTVDVVRIDGPDKEPLFDAEGLSEHDAERLAELKSKFK